MSSIINHEVWSVNGEPLSHIDHELNSPIITFQTLHQPLSKQGNIQEM